MKGMILAAGFGTRLKPLTDKLPKALIEYKGKPMIYYQIQRLKDLEVDEIVVNTHHLANMIEDYILEASKTFEIKIQTIYEPDILGTGGGILNAGNLLKKSDIAIVSNVDVFTNSNLKSMIEFHIKHRPLATLLVQKRKTLKYLEFDEEMKIKGRRKTEISNNSCFGFNGIHIISKEFFNLNIPIIYSDIIDIYLDLSKKGYLILGFDVGESDFIDLGKLKNLKI